MKKTFLSILLLFMATANVGAIDMKAAVKHAHPLPNFMPVITQHSDMLGLSPEQSKALAKWRKEHRPIAKQLIKAIIEGERQVHEASLNGSPKKEVMSQLEALLDKRRQLAEMKADCRDNMRKILNDEQWKQVVSLYRDML